MIKTYRLPLVGTSWKMNKTNSEALVYLERLQQRLTGQSRVSVFVLPPFTALAEVQGFLRDSQSNIMLGSQNAHWDDAGAFTGEVSVPMLKEIGCEFVEINHQERRHWFGETDETANWKIRAALRHGLAPIICLGEENREAWPEVESFLRKQLARLLQDVDGAAATGVILAYEPRWAIGVAEAAPPSHVALVHAMLRQLLAEKYNAAVAKAVPILYGGSVNLQNASELMVLPEVDGLFVGRAALDADSFARLVEISGEAYVRRRFGGPV